ncbi:hypothetical protein E2C01_086800 [Portunus trituberculatus]|uniref:Uncharacterized protein n=1 Tax=Portunus trituberculatus TaxID=210409 RepID=A0A5B7JBH8_PORTR|nr:hypothetical protein [Portunus trituberculatus]
MYASMPDTNTSVMRSAQTDGSLTRKHRSPTAKLKAYDTSSLALPLLPTHRDNVDGTFRPCLAARNMGDTPRVPSVY